MGKAPKVIRQVPALRGSEVGHLLLDLGVHPDEVEGEIQLDLEVGLMDLVNDVRLRNRFVFHMRKILNRYLGQIRPYA